MAQFDLYYLDTMLVVDLQSDFIGLDHSRIVAPLREAARYEFLPRLTPEVTVNGKPLVVHIHDLAAVPSRQLGPPVGDLREAADDLLRAMDILTRGF